MKNLWMSIFACVVVLLVGLACAPPAQAQTGNRPPCDFTDQFYADVGLDSALTAELDTEADGRFGISPATGQPVRQFGPPATQANQANWVADDTCATNDPTRRNFRILATTGGNADDGNSPFSTGTNETLDFISILAFIHNSDAFTGNPGAVTQNYSRTVGAIGPNGGLDNQQTNAGTTISIVPGTNLATGVPEGVNVRGIGMQFIVGNFPAFAAPIQTTPQGFATGPCAADMNASGVAPTPCFSVADVTTNGVTLSNAATPNLRQDWRFATNRNAMDGSDNNCINTQDTNCKKTAPNGLQDSPFGYFCDDLLGMWLVDYFWFTAPPNDPTCGPLFQPIGNANGFSLDGTPIILTENELSTLEADGCAADAKENPGGTDGGAVWLVCPAIPDPTNGAIASDAFLDAVRVPSGAFQDQFLAQNFTCLQTTGQFCTN